MRRTSKNPITRKLEACDVLHNAVVHLADLYKIAMPPELMKANLQARGILVDLQFKIYGEAERQLRCATQ